MDNLVAFTTPLYESYQNATVIEFYNSTSLTTVDTLGVCTDDLNATDVAVVMGGGSQGNIFPPAVQMLLRYLKIVVDAVGLLANAVVIVMIVSFRDLRTGPNFHFLNMALADALLLLDNLTRQISLLVDFDIFLALKCLPSYLHKVVVQTSVLTLVALSVDRYRLIVRPLQNLTEKSTLWVTLSLVSVWIVSFALHIPIPVFITYNGARCKVQFPWSHGDLAFKIYSNLILFLIPMTVVVYCNAHILKKLQRGKPGFPITRRPGNQIQFPDELVMTATSSSTNGSTLTTSSMPRRSIGRKSGRTKSFRSRSIRLVLTVVLVYILFYLPFYLFYTLHMIPGAISNQIYYEGHTYLAVLLLFNSALNPFIYALVGTNFRRHLLHMFCCFGCRRGCRVSCRGAEVAQPPTLSDTYSTE